MRKKLKLTSPENGKTLEQAAQNLATRQETKLCSIQLKGDLIHFEVRWNFSSNSYQLFNCRFGFSLKSLNPSTIYQVQFFSHRLTARRH